MKARVAIVLLALAACGSPGTRALRDGDVVFQTSKSAQSVAIQRATGSRYSHCGVIFLRKGEPFVFEAAGNVHSTPLRAWVDRGEGRHYVVKRLKDADTRLTPEALKDARAFARRLEGRPYDLTFEWSDDRIYCSELVWKLYDHALGVQPGALQKLRDFRLDDAVVKAKMRERYGGSIPLDEPVISPGAMFDWPGFETVVSR